MLGNKKKFRSVGGGVIGLYGYVPVISVCTLIIVLVTFFLQNYTRTLLRERLNERLMGITGTAALQFAGDEIKKLYELGSEATTDPAYRKNVLLLQRIRNANKNVRFAYIIGKTPNPNIVQFIADADAIVAEPTIDFSGDGVVDDDDITKPGDEYDATDFPGMRMHAFEEPSVEAELSVDSFGTLLSAYAPIRTSDGKVTAALAIDVEVSDFSRLVNTTYVPFLLFVIVLIFLISFLTIFLIRIWKNRVTLLQEIDRQKDELLGIVAHQLARPITAIRWDLESLLDGDMGKLNDAQKSEAQTMRSQAINLADLVSMILDVSRIQLGKIQLDPQPLDLQQLFSEMLDVVHPTIVEKKIRFEKHVPDSLPTVFLDKRYTRMTLENMLTNAVKYTPEGGTVKLSVSLSGGTFRCSVTDTGCGIPKAEQEKIFGKMYRASNVRNTVDGNGFGLYVAKGAIEAQGGKMWFTSAEGKGSTFFVELPLKLA